MQAKDLKLDMIIHTRSHLCRVVREIHLSSDSTVAVQILASKLNNSNYLTYSPDFLRYQIDGSEEVEVL